MKIILTDMDGTLVDSMEFLRELAVALVASDGQPEDSMRSLYMQTFGRPIVEQLQAWNNLYGHDSHARINVAKIVRLYESLHLLTAKHFPITDWCRALAMMGRTSDIGLGLITSTNKKIVTSMPQMRCVPWDFIGGYDGKGTEKREQIQRGLTAMGVTSYHHETVYVGDALSDREIADSLGIPYFYPSGTLLRDIFHRWELL